MVLGRGIKVPQRGHFGPFWTHFGHFFEHFQSHLRHLGPFETDSLLPWSSKVTKQLKIFGHDFDHFGSPGSTSP